MTRSSQALYTRSSRQEQRKSAPLSDGIFVRRDKPHQPRLVLEEIRIERLVEASTPSKHSEELDAAFAEGVQAGLDAAAQTERDEFAGDSAMERNPNEHPEQAFRRGLQQGAAEVFHALEQARALPDRLQKRIRDYAYGALWKFRHSKRRPLSRHIGKDRPPRLEINQGMSKWRTVPDKAKTPPCASAGLQVISKTLAERSCHVE